MRGPVTLLFITLTAPTLAGIQLDGTRVIYPAGKREVTLSVTNQADTPRLLQAWIDDGNADTPPALSAVPFIVTPPVFRLDPQKGQRMRLVYTGGPLPQDRESVFWLNVLEVPPKETRRQDDSRAIKVSIRSRLKVFYRPKELSGSPKEAVTQLRWRRVQAGETPLIECENPTAFNVSFNHIGLKGKPVKDSEKQSGMCPAKGKQRFSLAGKTEWSGGRLVLTTIDDLGGYQNSEAVFSY